MTIFFSVTFFKLLVSRLFKSGCQSAASVPLGWTLNSSAVCALSHRNVALLYPRVPTVFLQSVHITSELTCNYTVRAYTLISAKSYDHMLPLPSHTILLQSEQ